jgi:hypothetical protein
MSNANVKISATGGEGVSKMEAAIKKAKPKSNVSDMRQVVQIDIDRLISRYMALESALHEIAAVPAGMPPAQQNITMRNIAKKALGI